MVTVTISVPESVYAWLAQKAASSNQSVQELIEDQVQKLRSGDSDEPEFLEALQGSIARNSGALKRLAK